MYKSGYIKLLENMVFKKEEEDYWRKVERNFIYDFIKISDIKKEKRGRELKTKWKWFTKQGFTSEAGMMSILYSLIVYFLSSRTAQYVFPWTPLPRSFPSCYCVWY